MASGRFVLRIEPGLHEALRAAAAEAGLSLNEYCARQLAGPASHVAVPFVEVVERAASVFGSELRAVVAYGSWARGELVEGSDLDVLVVLADSVELRRGLYDEWDVEPQEWEGRRVEVHLVHLPGAGAALTGLWAEVAMDGVVLWDRGLTVSRGLVGLRARIAAGEVVRREVDGQVYWTEAG